jgi:hypothetical protein
MNEEECMKELEELDEKALKKDKRQRKKTARQLRAEEDRRILKNAAILRTMPDNIAEALANARAKPIWCSDVRWRMELNRRRNRHII